MTVAAALTVAELLAAEAAGREAGVHWTVACWCDRDPCPDGVAAPPWKRAEVAS